MPVGMFYPHGLPNYDTWKTAAPELTAAEEREIEEKRQTAMQMLRDEVGGSLIDYSAGIDPADVRRIVLEELAKIAPEPKA